MCQCIHAYIQCIHAFLQQCCTQASISGQLHNVPWFKHKHSCDFLYLLMYALSFVKFSGEAETDNLAHTGSWMAEW